MTAKSAFSPFYAVEQSRKNWPIPRPGLKPSANSLLTPPGKGQLSYPSPPMSTHLSPPLPPAELSRGAASEPPTLIPERSPSSNGTATNLPISSSAGLQTTSPTHALPPQHSGRFPDGPPLNLSLSGSIPSQPSSFGVLNTAIVASSAPAFAAGGPVLAGQSTNRTGRKSKAHVQSACINCKRAHLSCDVQRPCGRCVASGKQDTCYDVAHKKRGRPRLRQDGDFKVDRLVAQSARLSVPNGNGIHGPRPLAAPRQQRADSLQPLRSHGPERSRTHTPSLPPPHQPFHAGFHHPRAQSIVALAPAEVPTAFLDVDLTILRANQPFQQILYDGKSVQGCQITEIVASADAESFQSIRNRLRAEREEREPSYMPPILQSGQDPIQGVSEADVERLTYRFADHQYTWTRNPGGPNAETLPARVRLAKSTAYFVVVTLPSFRPTPPKTLSPVEMQPYAPPVLPPIQAHPGNGYANGGGYPPRSSSYLPPCPRPSAGTYSYPQYNPRNSYPRALIPSSLPSYSTPDAPLDTRSFPPRTSSMIGEVIPRPPTRGEILSERGNVNGKRASTAEDDLVSPKKRQRVGIDEVLQS